MNIIASFLSSKKIALSALYRLLETLLEEGSFEINIMYDEKNSRYKVERIDE